MTKASDNIFPRLLISEGGSTSTPSAAQVTVYAKANGLLYSKDDAGTETALGGAGAEVLPWAIHIPPEMAPSATPAGTWAIAEIAQSPSIGFGNGDQCITNDTGSPAQNDEINWPVVLAAGTWTIALRHRKSTNLGIYTFKLDSTSVGTIDGYAGSVAAGNSTITGISVATTGKYTLKVVMATKHASSSGYNADIYGITLLRTA